MQSREAHLDWEYIRKWCRIHDTEETLRALIDSLPEIPAGWIKLEE